MEILRQLVVVARVKIALRNVENFAFFFLGDLFGHREALKPIVRGENS